MSERHASFNPIRVQKLLSGLDYPIDKRAIIDKARAEGADADTLAQLDHLPEKDYESPISVSREMGKIGRKLH